MSVMQQKTDNAVTLLGTKGGPAGRVAQIATQAGVKRLALNHLIPSDDPDFGPEDWHREVSRHWQGPVHLGIDGMRIILQ